MTQGPKLFLKRFESPLPTETPRTAHPKASIFVPKGWKVLSGGARVKYYGVGQLLTRSFPLCNDLGNPVGWLVSSKDHLKKDCGQIQAFAIAIWDPYDSWDVVVCRSTSTVEARPLATATLPDGYVLVGGGADAKLPKPGNLLVQSQPTSDSTWTASSTFHLKASTTQIVAYAVGIKHAFNEIPLEHRIVVKTSILTQHPEEFVLSQEEGWSFAGGGAAVSEDGVGAGNMLVNLVPSRDGQRFYASSKDHLTMGKRCIIVFGIELRGAKYTTAVTSI